MIIFDNKLYISKVQIFNDWEYFLISLIHFTATALHILQISVLKGGKTFTDYILPKKATRLRRRLGELG